MTTIAIQDQYMKVLSRFGDEQQVAQNAIEEYIGRKAREQVARIVLEQAELEARYGMNLKTFRQRIATDGEYLNWLNQKQPLWEEDLAHWSYTSEEMKEWRQTEQALSEN